MKGNTTRRAIGALVTASAVVAFAATSASADPGEYRPLTGTGSDTTQYVMGALGEAITIGGDKVIGSYYAVGSATIQTREDGVVFNRPNGSGNGLRALTASINPDGDNTWPVSGGIEIEDQLDFARSSSGPGVEGTDLTFIPFAADAVSYAYSDYGDASVPTGLTLDDLADIYKGDVTTYLDKNGVTRTYIPRLPQTGSGTRNFFLSSIGLTDADVSWIGDLVQENDGSQIDAIGELVPFSVASWIAQNNRVVPNTIAGNIVGLGAIDDDFLGVVPPVRFAALNPAFPVDRLVYNVVETSRLSGTSAEDVLLQDTFKGASSEVCQASAVITTYGFGTIPNCGDTTTYKSGYVRT
ncbi:MAG: substrate-binding domain-containing protein [Bifidobacteriaceae bacterium]|jgi:ABC-type phosphate transport system substrate-binding protein|nr:substrate-binding domain-containing protein [Bifidobacteriaceae bacterium]